MEYGKTKNDYFQVNAVKKYFKLKKYYAEKFSETTDIKYKVNIGEK